MANNKWITTFVYQQELKSYYMNSLLYSVVRPGVYNPGIEIKKDKSKITLKLHKGTTLIFSNDYVGSDAGRYRRSFNTRKLTSKDEYSGLAAESVYLIKCTALNDEVYELELKDTAYAGGFYYITAYFKYEPNQGNNATTPSFGLFKNNEDASGAYFVDAVAQNNNGVTLIEGLTVSDDTKNSISNSINRSFLHLGVIKFDDNGEVEAFTSRGLPEYRYNIVSDKMSINPDIIFDVKNGINNNIYIDLRNVLHKGGVYSVETDWERLYGIAGYETPENPSIELCTLDKGKKAADVVFAVLPSTKNVNELNTELNTGSITFKSCCIDEIESVPSIDAIMLDTCVDNVERLLNFIKNKNFIPYAVNKLMQEGEINPETGDSLIPICIVFRNNDKINPANVLSLMDLEYKACKVNTLSIDQDAYSIVPVIE